MLRRPTGRGCQHARPSAYTRLGVLEPDLSRGLAGQPEAATGAASPQLLQILATEHWSLLTARNLGYNEAMSRASIFVAALSGAVVALALVAQATDFGSGFVAFALVLLPVVFFLGCATVARLGQVNIEDAHWVKGNEIESVTRTSSWLPSSSPTSWRAPTTTRPESVSPRWLGASRTRGCSPSFPSPASSR